MTLKMNSDRQKMFTKRLLAFIIQQKTFSNFIPPYLKNSPSSLWLVGSNRTHQSDCGWKLLSQIRYAWFLVGKMAPADLKFQNSNMDETSFIKLLGPWRTWENPDLKKSKLFSLIFGKYNNNSKPSNFDSFKRIIVKYSQSSSKILIFDSKSEVNEIQGSQISCHYDTSTINGPTTTIYDVQLRINLKQVNGICN